MFWVFKKKDSVDIMYDELTSAYHSSSAEKKIEAGQAIMFLLKGFVQRFGSLEDFMKLDEHQQSKYYDELKGLESSHMIIGASFFSVLLWTKALRKNKKHKAFRVIVMDMAGMAERYNDENGYRLFN